MEYKVVWTGIRHGWTEGGRKMVGREGWMGV